MKEEWLVEPRQDKSNPNLWSPGVKWGVKEGSFMHHTELFGPVLAVMRAKNLGHAIQIANETPFGLTSGLQSLDPREQKFWLAKIEAGNLYINRSITGAIVGASRLEDVKPAVLAMEQKLEAPTMSINLRIPSKSAFPKKKPPSEPPLKTCPKF